MVYNDRKKGNSYGAVIMENENSSFDAIVMNFPAAEHNDKCSCNPCSCPNCGCNN
ncbi:metallothionein-like protein [Cucumis melo var. makuwa]|uniref:Metallothionein-like protein n=1 Tax=Cucumis melo var. makuwa TaxID=1194695 RepID=A0A5D3BSV6_CUCMM|nr:metallothionein-like protein [Cucumis melo var. makuwa]